MDKKLVCALGAAALGAFAADAKAETPFARPMVSITLDDGLKSQFDLARPALNARGLKSTYYLISKPIADNWTGYMSLSEARTLANDGNEIGAHSVTHQHMTTLTPAQVESELADCMSWL